MRRCFAPRPTTRCCGPTGYGPTPPWLGPRSATRPTPGCWAGPSASCRPQSVASRPNGFLSIPFVVISVLGLTVFFDAGAWPVGLLFVGLALIYVAEFFASFRLGVKVAADGRESTNLGEKALGVLHIVVGLWLMYLTVATTLDITSGFHL